MEYSASIEKDLKEVTDGELKKMEAELAKCLKRSANIARTEPKSGKVFIWSDSAKDTITTNLKDGKTPEEILSSASQVFDLTPEDVGLIYSYAKQTNFLTP